MPHPAAINAMFARVARRYDLANHVLSGGVDFWWRRRLVRAVARHPARQILDLATGSGDRRLRPSRADCAPVRPSPAWISASRCSRRPDGRKTRRTTPAMPRSRFATVTASRCPCRTIPSTPRDDLLRPAQHGRSPPCAGRDASRAASGWKALCAGVFAAAGLVAPALLFVSPPRVAAARRFPDGRGVGPTNISAVPSPSSPTAPVSPPNCRPRVSAESERRP